MTDVQTPLGGGDVRIWAEPGGPIMLKVVDSITGTDPVELNEDEAETVAAILTTLARQIREADAAADNDETPNAR